MESAESPESPSTSPPLNLSLPHHGTADSAVSVKTESSLPTASTAQTASSAQTSSMRTNGLFQLVQPNNHTSTATVIINGQPQAKDTMMTVPESHEPQESFY